MREMALKKGSFTGNKHAGGLNMEITLEQLNEKIIEYNDRIKVVILGIATIVALYFLIKYLYRKNKQKKTI